MSQTLTPHKPTYTTPRPEFIGTAHMQSDGEIVMNLRAEGPNGLLGDGQVRVRPGEPTYASVREHLGPDLKAGGPEVPVRPFTPD